MHANELWKVAPAPLLFLALVAPAQAQFASANTGPALHSAGGGSGAFLGGSDHCATPTPIGSGDLFGVAFDLSGATTGVEGQNEANCYFFGLTGIDSDVWFEWSATAMSQASMTTCASTSVDTKVAVWPAGGCPLDGTSITCNDDACGFQSTALWAASAGTTYLLQLGTFPGASSGVGTFDISQSAPAPALACGQYDDGTTENGLGLTAGGEMLWIQYSACAGAIGGVDTMYGMPGGGAPPNGNASRVAVWEDTDCDGDPTTGLVLLHSFTTVVTDAGTDTLVYLPFDASVDIPSGCAFVGVTADQAAGEFPAPMDETNPTPNAWVAGSTLGPGAMDLADLNNNSVPPMQLQQIGFPAAWVLKAGYCDVCCMRCDQDGYDPLDRNCIIWKNPPCSGIGSFECFGGPGLCPCGNDGGFGEGCANSVGSGALLSGNGTPSFSADTLVLAASQTPNQPGIFFQGDNSLSPAPVFGDGLRCCGNNIVRIGTYSPTGNATDTGAGNLVGGIGPPISQHPGNAGLQPGDTRCYQWWYRDPSGPCMGSFNLSNGYVLTWLP